MKHVLLGMFGTPEIIIIAVIVLLLFGAKRIPQLMRGMGSGIKEFKEGLNENEKSKEPSDKSE